MSSISPFAASTFHDWRRQVLEVALRFTSVILPAMFVVLLASRRSLELDPFLIVLTIITVLVVALRYFQQLSFRIRAGAFLAVLQIAGIDAIASSGFLPSSGMAALASVSLCGIFFGRRAMIALLTITPLTYLIVGLLVTNGLHVLRTQDANPMIFGHWVRAACVIAMLSAMLGSAVDYVVRQVESGYRAALGSAGELRTAYDQLGMLHRRLELAKEEERSVLARELHDEMGQTLTVLKLHMQLIFRGTATPTPTQQGELIELVDRLISHVRKISLGLRPTMLDEMGLEPALTAFIDGQTRRGAAQMKLEVQGFTDRLSPEIEHACFRLVQESVTNTLRHANAKNLSVSVRREQQDVRIAVKDDGSGFSEKEAAIKAERGHLGLVGMRERVRLLGGEMTVGPAGGNGAHPGTLVEVTLPATPPRAP
jgi:signal transduction histidine kinase